MTEPGDEGEDGDDVDDIKEMCDENTYFPSQICTSFKNHLKSLDCFGLFIASLPYSGNGHISVYILVQFYIDKPARLTIRVLWFLFLIVKSEVKKQIGRR